MYHATDTTLLLNILNIYTPHIAPKLIARYIHDFYKAAQNIQIPTIQSMVSELYFIRLLYFL